MKRRIWKRNEAHIDNYCAGILWLFCDFIKLLLSQPPQKHYLNWRQDEHDKFCEEKKYLCIFFIALARQPDSNFRQLCRARPRFLLYCIVYLISCMEPDHLLSCLLKCALLTTFRQPFHQNVENLATCVVFYFHFFNVLLSKDFESHLFNFK